MMRKVLLACGAVSSVWYVATDIVVSLRYEGYRYADQAFSELLATGSPVRRFGLVLSVPYNLLVAAFGAGVWASRRRKRASRLTGASLIGFAAVSQITPLFFQMDRRGATVTRRGSLHGPMTLAGSIFTLLAMAFGAPLFGRRFRLYTVGTVLALIVFGVWTSLDIPRMVRGERTPWLGVKERVNIYATMLWMLVLAIAHLRAGDRPAAAERPAASGEVPELEEAHQTGSARG